MAGLVSCIVPVYNGEKYLGEAIDSILGQSYRPLEVLVCDDGSTDGTAHVAARYGDAVRYLRQANAGPCAARNLGVAHALGEYLAFLDADDVWVPGKLARQMALFDARPDLDFSVGHVQNFVEADSSQSVDPALLVPLAGFTTVALLVRRTSFERVGVFNASLKHSSETDWFLRAEEAGAVRELLPDVLVRRRLHGSNRSVRFASRSRNEYLHTVKAALDRRRSRPQAGARPIPLFERLIIESQANCNRACWFCPRTYDRSGKYLDGHGNAVMNRMPTATILNLLDQASALGFTGRVGFHHYSEPLLDDRNVSLAWEARNRGMLPYLHTNGDFLRRDPDLCREVSSVYEHIVVGLYDYDTAEELERAKREWRARLPDARLDFSPIGRSSARHVHSIVTPRAFVPYDGRMAAPDVVFANGPCHRPMVRMIVQHDGEMAHCCEDLTGAFSLGNVHEASLESLWFSDRHVQIVQSLAAGRRDQHAMCAICPLPPTGPLPGAQRIVMQPRSHAAGAPAAAADGV